MSSRVMRSLIIGFVLFVATVAAVDVFLTPNVEACPDLVCRFENASLWSTGVVPTSNDTVYLNATTLVNVTTLSFVVDTQVEVHSIYISRVNLTILSSGNLSVISSVEVDTAVFEIQGKVITEYLHLKSTVFSVVSSGIAEIGFLDSDGITTVDELSQLNVDGVYISLSNTTIMGPVNASANSSFSIMNTVYLGFERNSFLSRPLLANLILAAFGNYTFEGGLASTEISIPSNTKANVFNSVAINRINFENPTSELNLFEVGELGPDHVASHLGIYDTPLLGEGRLFIHSSTLTISSLTPTDLNCTVTLNGTNYITLEHFRIVKTNTFLFETPQTNVTWSLTDITFSAYTSLFGQPTLYGPIVVTQDIDFFGAPEGVTLLTGTLDIHNATLYAPSLTIGDNSTVTLDIAGKITAYTVVIERAGTLTIGGTPGYQHDEYTPTAVSGDLWNDGTLAVTQRNLLEVSGNYVHSPNAILKVVIDNPPHPTDVNVTAGALWVLGEVQIHGGHVEAIVLTDKPATSFNVIESPNAINGTFESLVVDQSAFGSKVGDFDISYQNHTIVMKFTAVPHDSKKDFWHTVWPGIIFGVAGAIILAVIVFFVVRRYRQKKYQAIP